MYTLDVTDAQKKTAIISLFFIGAIIILVAIWTQINFAREVHGLKFPTLKATTQPPSGDVKQDVENYKNLVAAIKTKHEFLNDILVVGFLKTIFTTLLAAVVTFVFGKPLLLAVADRIGK